MGAERSTKLTFIQEAIAQAKLGKHRMARLARHNLDHWNMVRGRADASPRLDYASRYWRDHLRLACENVLGKQRTKDLQCQTEVLIGNNDNVRHSSLLNTGSGRALTFKSLGCTVLLSPDQRSLRITFLNSVTHGP